MMFSRILYTAKLKEKQCCFIITRKCKFREETFISTVPCWLGIKTFEHEDVPLCGELHNIKGVSYSWISCCLLLLSFFPLKVLEDKSRNICKVSLWKLFSVLQSYTFPGVSCLPCPSLPRAFVQPQNLCFTRDFCCFYLFSTWCHNSLSGQSFPQLPTVMSQLRRKRQFRKEKIYYLFQAKVSEF